ncbi:hypothetical protein NUACC21_62330 [Scytonema sp. NUACC21]
MSLAASACCVVTLHQQQEQNIHHHMQYADASDHNSINNSKYQSKHCTIVENGRVVIKEAPAQSQEC